MDRSITIRYFRLESIGNTALFVDAVNSAYALGRSPHERERVVGHGARIRLEDRTTRRDLLFGEIVRVQTENIPPEARQAGLVPLTIGGLGHSIAFAYDDVSSVIAIQFNPQGVSLGRLLDYLTNVVEGGRYSYHPLVNDDAWERYNRGQPRKLILSVAAPQNLAALPGIPGSVLSASRDLAEITEAPVVTIEVSMGRARGGLFKRAVDEIVSAFTSEENESNVTDLTVVTKEEGSPSDAIDFLNDLARDQETLDLPSDNHSDHLQRRYRFLERSFRDRLDSFRELYAPEN